MYQVLKVSSCGLHMLLQVSWLDWPTLYIVSNAHWAELGVPLAELVEHRVGFEVFSISRGLGLPIVLHNENKHHYHHYSLDKLFRLDYLR